MSAHAEWKKKCINWRNGRLSDRGCLDATAIYLEESANWIEVRDWLIHMGKSQTEIINWFADQDFPDFSEALNEGWAF